MHLISRMLLKWANSTSIAHSLNMFTQWKEHSIQYNHLSLFCLQIKFLKVEMEKKTKIIKDLQQEVSHQSFT